MFAAGILAATTLRRADGCGALLVKDAGLDRLHEVLLVLQAATTLSGRRPRRPPIPGSGSIRGFDEPLAPIGAGLLEGLGERLPRGRENLDERVPVASQASELGRVAEVEPGPERVAVVPPDPLDLGLELLPGGHRTSI